MSNKGQNLQFGSRELVKPEVHFTFLVLDDETENALDE